LIFQAARRSFVSQTKEIARQNKVHGSDSNTLRIRGVMNSAENKM